MDIQFIIVLVIGLTAVSYFIRHIKQATQTKGCDGNCGDCPLVQNDGPSGTAAPTCATMNSDLNNE